MLDDSGHPGSQPVGSYRSVEEESLACLTTATTPAPGQGKSVKRPRPDSHGQTNVQMCCEHRSLTERDPFRVAAFLF